MNLLGKEEEIVETFRKLGFHKLTQIQQQAIPKIINSETDLVISAPTGSGKTEAAIIPILWKILQGNTIKKGILVIYI
ncbi:MAG: DEAD/DEAH box helicase, partial [Ignisphaera sp.]